MQPRGEGGGSNGPRKFLFLFCLDTKYEFYLIKNSNSPFPHTALPMCLTLTWEQGRGAGSCHLNLPGTQLFRQGFQQLWETGLSPEDGG